MKHIAVNTRLLLSERLEGISRFGWEVLQRMVERNPEIQFSFLFDRQYDPRFVQADNVKGYVIPPQARHPLLWFAWFHYQIPRKLDQLGADLLFSPEFYLSTHPTIPQIPVFHDLAYEHYPQDLKPFASWYCRRYSPRFAERAAHILTVSSFSKADLVERYQIPDGKISVVYNGASSQFQPLSETQKAAVRAKYTGGTPYFHFVGTLNPRKNIENLLRAFDQFKEESDHPHQLLIVGRKGWKYQAALDAYESMQHKDAVHFTGFVEDEELPAIYAASEALCYTPYLEGFGIPLLEAMQSETAIITSDRTSMPEVAGDAALLVDPFSVEAICVAMRRIVEEPASRNAYMIC
ncbi:MAG: glycosyltransferase family 1 protein [Bacteroidota bacterium]